MGLTTARTSLRRRRLGSTCMWTSVVPPGPPAMSRTWPTWTPATRTSAWGTRPSADTKAAFTFRPRCQGNWAPIPAASQERPAMQKRVKAPTMTRLERTLRLVIQ